MVITGLTRNQVASRGLVGSNPTVSAITKRTVVAVLFCYGGDAGRAPTRYVGHISRAARERRHYFIILSRFSCPFAVRRIPPSYIKLARHCRPFCYGEVAGRAPTRYVGHISRAARERRHYFIVLSRFFCPFAVKRIPPSYIKLARHCRPFCYGEVARRAPTRYVNTYLVLHANGDIILLFYLAFPVRSL